MTKSIYTGNNNRNNTGTHNGYRNSYDNERERERVIGMTTCRVSDQCVPSPRHAVASGAIGLVPQSWLLLLLLVF